MILRRFHLTEGLSYVVQLSPGMPTTAEKKNRGEYKLNSKKCIFNSNHQN